MHAPEHAQLSRHQAGATHGRRPAALRCRVPWRPHMLPGRNRRRTPQQPGHAACGSEGPDDRFRVRSRVRAYQRSSWIDGIEKRRHGRRDSDFKKHGKLIVLVCSFKDGTVLLIASGSPATENIDTHRSLPQSLWINLYGLPSCLASRHFV